MKTPLCICAAALLAGCSSLMTPTSIVQQPTQAPPRQVASPAQANGAIFQAASYRPMFEDRQARLVGDILTIAITESTTAAKNGSATNSKSTAATGAINSFLGVKPSSLSRLGVSAASERDFEETGAAASSNNFSSTITVTVLDVLANGNLVVSGEKQVAFDKGVEFVRFSGVVSPSTIGAGNVVPSTKVADARIEYRSNTRLDPAEVLSSLARFFLSVAPL